MNGRPGVGDGLREYYSIVGYAAPDKTANGLPVCLPRSQGHLGCVRVHQEPAGWSVHGWTNPVEDKCLPCQMPGQLPVGNVKAVTPSVLL